jgi:hypothetical protein
MRATTVDRTDCAARAADPFVWRFVETGRKIGTVVVTVAR